MLLSTGFQNITIGDGLDSECYCLLFFLQQFILLWNLFKSCDCAWVQRFLAHIWINNLHAFLCLNLFIFFFRIKRKWRSRSWVHHQSQRKFNLWSIMPEMSLKSSERQNTSGISFPHWLSIFSLQFLNDQKSSSRSFSTQLNSLPVVASFFLIPPIVTVPWLSGTSQWTTGDVWAQHGKDGSDICRHQCLHVAHDVPGYGRLSLHAGLEWSYELWREDCTSIQVNGSAVMAVTYNLHFFKLI